MEVYEVADMMMDMEVDKVADKVADMVKKIIYSLEQNNLQDPVGQGSFAIFAMFYIRFCRGEKYGGTEFT